MSNSDVIERKARHKSDLQVLVKNNQDISLKKKEKKQKSCLPCESTFSHSSTPKMKFTCSIVFNAFARAGFRSPGCNPPLS